MLYLASAIVRAMALASLVFVVPYNVAEGSTTHSEVAVVNVTRIDAGDIFTIIGTDCGPTRCMEASHGTALGARRARARGAGGGGGGGGGGVGSGDGGCPCQCRAELPAYREDQRLCVDRVEECEMASFGRGGGGGGGAGGGVVGATAAPTIPAVFLPLKGQIIHPSKEIVFTEVENAICLVSSAQYLSDSGWITIRDTFDNDVPFGLYRDEGKTFLQWRGSGLSHARLEGRLVLAHVLCSAPPAYVATPCAAFRVAGTAHPPLDVPSIVFTAGELVTGEPAAGAGGGRSLSVLESLAVGVCVLLLVFVYAAGIAFYVHYKRRARRKERDAEHAAAQHAADAAHRDRTLDMDNVTLKTNPLLKMDPFGADYLHDTLSDVSERTEENLDVSDEPVKKPHIIAAMVHSTRNKSSRKLREHMSPSPSDKARQRRSVSPAGASPSPAAAPAPAQRRAMSPDALERAPHSHVAIVDCRGELDAGPRGPERPASAAVRKKLYFNPVFFEPEHLKDPPPAAIEFLIKIREVMSIAKEKMTSKKFFPVLTDIQEEESYHTIDLGWDVPCGRRGRRFSAISLKRENSRRAHRCTGCPGCDTSSLQDHRQAAFTRSNSCKSCVSDDFKQKIVRKWLDEVPPPLQPPRPIKSVAMVSGTPRTVEPKVQEVKLAEVSSPRTVKRIEKKDIIVVKKEVTPPHATRRVRKKLPPPPPPPGPPPPPPEEVPKEIKQKMEAVIKELSECRRVEPTVIEDVRTEFAKPIEPRLVIPVLAAETPYDEFPMRRMPEIRYEYEMDSLERGAARKRRFSLAYGGSGKRRISNRDGAVSMDELEPMRNINEARERLSQSCMDVRKAVESFNKFTEFSTDSGNRSLPVSEVFVDSSISKMEPMYGNVARPGALTIQVRGSPERERRTVTDDFDPDTLDRKPSRLRASEKKTTDERKRVDKILLKSAGSFKYKTTDHGFTEDPIVPTDSTFTRKTGSSLRQIYEAKTKVNSPDNLPYTFFGDKGFNFGFEKDGFSSFARSAKKTDSIRQVEGVREPKPPVPPKARRGGDLSPKYANLSRLSPTGDGRRARLSPDEKDRPYSRAELLHSRRSGRKSARFRNRRADFKKSYKTEDSGYLSTDSNESKRRARFMMQIRARAAIAESGPAPPAGSDTDELESLGDGRSESGAESVETDSVFFGNFDSEPERMYAELALDAFAAKAIPRDAFEQIDSGFVGETNILVSGDSDSEHRSVISIVTGRDGRASSASARSVALREEPYAHSVEC